MTTRFSAIDEKTYGVEGVKSGYDTGVKSDLSIPPCGIEDVDTALFSLFDKEIQPMVGGKDSAELRKVPIIFAAGEKWAMLKKKKPLRDKNNTLILPLITIMRTNVVQGFDDVVGRGINQQTGEIVVRRRLDASDRDYQNLINKLFILNQVNVAVDESDAPIENQILTSRDIGELRNDPATHAGALLRTNRTNNIFETLVVPAPQFYTANYEVTVWAQYTQHMNQIIEKLMSSFLPQAQSWKLTTSKGYWFIATVEGGNFNIETNFDDMSSAERYIKCNIPLKVPAYVWASNAPGVPIPVKRYVSSPIIDFSISALSKNVKEIEGYEEFPDSYMLGNDDPTLPLRDGAALRVDQRRSGETPVMTNARDRINPTDPALSTLPRGFKNDTYKKITVGNNDTRYVRVVTTNEATGETVYSAAELEGLKLVTVKST